ncbi:uncharacterized protein BDV14DRAFT_203463 [Aspergillus stella-maris]|uniref:uncharacterized protein n=1 Tax=Aspergillus stella-maris TaxID=1810926 RepID=UPI003CCCAE3E
MPPKRSMRASNRVTRQHPHPSSPNEEPRTNHQNDVSEEHASTVSNESIEPVTPEDLNLSEPLSEAGEEMPEETEHMVDKVKENDSQTTGKRDGFAGGYNALKSYNGKYYSGMAVGGSHTWNYDQGVWKETKEEPDLWKVDYRTNKRRARNAPVGSGAPVGTEYHWLIVGHQHVKKVDADTYETHLEGSKYKLAYKSATSDSWSVPTVRKQREREVELLGDAKLRVQGLPPVSEKVKVEKQEKGQKKLDAMFGGVAGSKRKAGE